MDTLRLCRAMEAVCIQHAVSDGPQRERWLDLMEEWSTRAHKEASRRFQAEAATQPNGAPSPTPSHSNARD
jgi:hypothetical protein